MGAVQWLDIIGGSKIKPKDKYAMQLYALAVLFYSTSGTEDHVNPTGNWIDQNEWMAGTGFCSWYGVVCGGDPAVEGGSHSDGNGFVKVLNLSSNGLDGTLPSELSALSLLLTIDLSGNGLTGTLPKKLAELHELRNLNMRENQLTGMIPTEYGVKLSNLRQLNLGMNQFQGSIPLQIEHMVNLRSLGLERNQFEGNIPDLVDLNKLNRLHLESNNLDGPFPESLSKLTSLVEL